MKKVFFTSLLLLVATIILWSQAPQAMTYKAIAKDDWGVALPNKYITLRFTIIQGSENGPMVYRETINTTTNKFGLMSVQIGTGTPDIGIFSTIDWSTGVYYIMIEMDPKGGTNFKLEDPAHQLLSVPYALYASNTGGGVDNDSDPANEVITEILLNGNSLEITESSSTKTVDLGSLSEDEDILQLENRVAQLEALVGELLNIDFDGDGFSVANGDCNDGDPDIHPGAFDICEDGIDQDCDGVDPVCQGIYYDDDGDGYTEYEGDCNDNDQSIYPGATEICGDGIDQDCDGEDAICQSDMDGDGFTVEEGDCDDNDADRYPGAAEICDNIDNNCNGLIDEGNICGEGYQCVAGQCVEIQDYDEDGFTISDGDCDDTNPAIHPGASDGPDACDGIDNDCDGIVDDEVDFNSDDQNCGECGNDCNVLIIGSTCCDGECVDLDTDNSNCGECGNQCPEGWHCENGICVINTDTDGDGVPDDQDMCPDGEQGWTSDPTTDNDGDGCKDDTEDDDDDNDGWTELAGDCNDKDATIYPGAPEICGDGIDQDCDGSDKICSVDNDGDGWSLTDGDCNDNDKTIYPGAPEICGDGIDQDCDGVDLPCDDVDNDGDGWTLTDGDCDDNDLNIHPLAVEIDGDGIDSNCDASDDLLLPSSFDWRNVFGQNWMSNIKNQGTCGSCFAVATVAAFEAKLKIQSNYPEWAIDLSEQEFLSCGIDDYQCGGGSPTSVLDYIKDYGIVEESVFPYTSSTSFVPTCPNLEGHKKYKIQEWESLHNIIDPVEIKKTLINNGPIIVLTYADQLYYGYTDGILNPPDYLNVNKAMVLIGYNDTERYWIVANTWGDLWGENGYYRLSYDATYAISKYLYVINSVIID